MYLVFVGNCVVEWEQWFNGVLYQYISVQGGGINVMVLVICVCVEEMFYLLVCECMMCFVSEGVMLLEIKFGYGLELVIEEKLLCVVVKFVVENVIDISFMLLVVYVMLVEYCDDLDGYIILVCEMMILQFW